MSGLEALLTGKTLVKRYRIQEVIGRGGFAAVYRADDERLGRPVAVKVITLPAPTPEVRERLHARFEREARAAASLPHHPNVVAVHDFGTDPELGLDFLVMELLQGENLAQRLEREGRPPLREALRVLRDAAEGLALGHRAGLIHRDVKPGNIFLSEPHDDEPSRVCILDFGIARIADEDGAGESTLTRATRGENPLSPAYASPEQLRGERALTPASDVFGLGVVGYQLLTGEKPFASDPGQRARGRAAPRPVRELNPEVPGRVAAIIDRAMADEPEARHPHAGSFADELDEVMGGGDDDITLFAPVRRPAAKAGGAAAAGALAGAAAAGASPPPAPADADERTVLQPAPRARPAAPKAAPAPPPSTAEARPAPRRRGSRTWMLIVPLLVLVAAAALFALNGGGGGGAAGERAAGDTLARPVEPVASGEGGDEVEGGAGEVTVPPEETGTEPGTGEPVPDPGAGAFPSTPITPPIVDGGGGAPPARPAPQRPAPRPSEPAPSQPRSPAPQPPAPTPPQPQPQPPTPQQPQPQPPTPQPPTPQPQPPAPKPKPEEKPPVPIPLPPPSPAPRDTIFLPPPPIPPVSPA